MPLPEPPSPCGACNKIFKKSKHLNAKTEMEVNAYSYIRGKLGKVFKPITMQDKFCCRCYAEMKRLLKDAICLPQSDHLDEVVDSENSSDDPVDSVHPGVPTNTILHFGSLDDAKLKIVTGLNSAQFDEVLQSVKGLVARKLTLASRLVMLLMKMRYDIPLILLSVLFGYSDKAAASRSLKALREKLTVSFVPKYLGLTNLSREKVMERVPFSSKQMYEVTDDSLVVIMDGTYIYTQKSSNFQMQRAFYSMHKGRPLIKPMMIVTPDGFIVDCIGPYIGRNNDASITANMLKDLETGFVQFFKVGDVVLVDRGFRDCLALLGDLGLVTKMPHFLSKSQFQLSTVDANEDRKITKLRWAVEAKNGHIKTVFKMFANTVPISSLPYIRDYLRIACALQNAFSAPVFYDSAERCEEISRMLSLVGKENALLKELEEKKILTRWSQSIWTVIDAASLPLFPKLTYDDLVYLTFGVYQIENSKSYTAEHVKDDGLYNMFYLIQSKDILKFKIQSRHTSSKKHELFLKVDFSKNGKEGVVGWYCKCPVGARVVGCCSHVTSVLWYLGIGRYEAWTKPAAYLSGLFIDASETKE